MDNFFLNVNSQVGFPTSPVSRSGVRSLFGDDDLDFFGFLNTEPELAAAIGEVQPEDVGEEESLLLLDANGKFKEASGPNRFSMEFKNEFHYRRLEDTIFSVMSSKKFEKDKKLKLSELDTLQQTLQPNITINLPIPLVGLISQILEEREAGEARSVPVSKGLAELIEKAYKSKQSVRVEVDETASIILRFREGRVSAEFLSSDQATVLYLKQQLAELKTRMDEQNLPVDTLESRQENSPRRQRQGNPQESDSNVV